MKSLLWIAVAVGVAGCGAMMPRGPSATAELMPTSGNAAKGTIAFVQQGDKVALSARLTGLSPGAHGFHIHEKGDCSAVDGMSAGGHFNPAAKPHGDPAGVDHHAGDMPMIVADASGNAAVDIVLSGVAIGSGTGDLLERAVIVHKDPDDFTTQPTGNSGARVACGVIRRA